MSKQILLYQDEQLARKLINDYKADIETLSMLIDALERDVIHSEMTVDQKTSLSENPAEYTYSLRMEIKENYPFPAAAPIKNLELLGIDYGEVNALLQKLNSDSVPCEIGENEIKPLESHIEQIKKGCEVYAANDTQKQAHAELTAIVEAANKLLSLKAGKLIHMEKFHIPRAFNWAIDFKQGKYILNGKKLAAL